MSTGPSPTDTSRDRFGWGDGDVEFFGEDGEPMTLREVKEEQLNRLRAEVEEDQSDAE